LLVTKEAGVSNFEQYNFGLSKIKAITQVYIWSLWKWACNILVVKPKFNFRK